MPKLADMSLEELYQRDKITPASIRVIQEKEDFSSISKTYCDKVCKAPCYLKNPEEVFLDSNPVDVLVLNPHPAMDDRWKSGAKVDLKNNAIYSFLMKKAIGRRRLSWRVSSVFKCRPIPSNAEARAGVPFGGNMPQPNNPNMTSSVIDKCAPYLMHEILEARPKVIISTTTEVTKSLGLKQCSNSKDRGSVHFIEVGNERIPVLLTRHPQILTMIRQNSSGDMWGPDYTSMLAADFVKAVRVACGEQEVPELEEALSRIQERMQIHIPETLEEAIEACKKIKSFSGTKAILSWDTETTSLDPWYEDARFLTHQFGYRRPDGVIQAVVFPLWHKDNTFYDANELWPHIVDLLVDPDLLKVAHNAAFDLKYTRVVTGVEVQGLVADTMLLLHAINSGIQGNYGLKQAVWDYLYHTGLGGYESKLSEEYAARVKAEAEAEKLAEKERLKAERAAERERIKAEKLAGKDSAPRAKATVSTPRKTAKKTEAKPDLKNVVGMMEKKKD